MINISSQIRGLDNQWCTFVCNRNCISLRIVGRPYHDHTFGINVGPQQDSVHGGHQSTMWTMIIIVLILIILLFVLQSDISTIIFILHAWLLPYSHHVLFYLGSNTAHLLPSYPPKYRSFGIISSLFYTAFLENMYSTNDLERIEFLCKSGQFFDNQSSSSGTGVFQQNHGFSHADV